MPSFVAKLWNRLQNPGSFELTEALFLRLLGLTYLAAFGSLWPQIRGLIGSHGIAPADRFLSAVVSQFGARAFLYVPSLFWFGVSDAALGGFCVLGCLASLLLLSGLFSRWSAAACYVLYLSLVTIGQPFMLFQWDALLLECGFLALFSGAPWLVWAYRFLLFRLMFESGAVKLASHDPNWRNLHALRYHFMTQPLPNPLAYYAYRAPYWFLDAGTAVTIGIELVAPFLLFGPRRIRQIGVGLLLLLQIFILLTGNYAFFNLLALALCMWGLDDQTFQPIARLLLRRFPAHLVPRSRLLAIAMNSVLALLMIAGVAQVAGIFSPRIARSAVAQPPLLSSLEAVNSYGLFAVMTTTRPEIVIEGSEDGTNWKEYSFRYKPGNLHRGLPLVAPYQPRLDWQMWFAALGNYASNPWVGGLLYRLLTAEPAVTGLLDPPPFPKPRYIRALLYDYDFTTPAERAHTGAIWQRRLRGTWFGPLSLRE